MRGTKTSAIPPVREIVKILQKHGITDMSYGIIISVKKRRDHRVTIKYHQESGAHMLSVTGKRYKQEFRVYDKISDSVILSVLNENLGENFRII